MTTSQRIVINGTSQQTSPIASTRAKVASDVPYYVSVGANPTAILGAANTRLIPGSRITDINMEDVNNKLAILGAGTAGNCTVTAIGV